MINADMGELRVARLEAKTCRKTLSSFSELAAFCWSRPPPRSVAGYQTAVICNKTTDLEQQLGGKEKSLNRDQKASNSNRDQDIFILLSCYDHLLKVLSSCHLNIRL